MDKIQKPTTVIPTTDATGTSPRDDERESVFSFLQEYLRILWRRKLVVIVITALATAAGSWWLNQQAPQYRATVSVIIDHSPPRILSNISDVVELGSPNDYRGQITYFETQYRIIKSREVAERVINRLGLWDSERLLTKEDGIETEGVSRTERDEALERANLPALLAARIQVNPVPNSMLVYIEFDDEDPEFASQVVNAVAEAYQEQNVAYKRRTVTDATSELQQMEARTRSAFEEAEDEVASYEAAREVGSIGNSRKAVDSRVQTLHGRLVEERNRAISLEAKTESLGRYARAKNIFKVQSAMILDNAVVQLLKRQIFEVKVDLADLKARYLEQHPEVQAKQEQLDVLVSSARREIRNLARSVKKDLEETRSVIGRLETELTSAQDEEYRLAAIERDYTRLVENRNRLKESFQVVSQRLIETTMSAQIETNNIRILEPATTPTKPVWPRRRVVLVGTLLVGLLLSMGLAFLLDFADATIKDWGYLEEQLGFKVLGVIPVVGEQNGSGKRRVGPAEQRKRDLFIYENPKSHVAEASRTLRTNLLFVASVRKLQTMLITSAGPTEGKSMIAVHTATSMASGGSRVLLVEGDMRRPRLAGSFEIPEVLGLSSLLVDPDAKLSDHVKQTTIPNFNLLACGPIPPNPAELLVTDRFREILGHMKEQYDMVLFDSPPLLPVTDATIMANMMDGVLVVVRAESTSRHALRHAVRNLGAVEADVLGAVFNYYDHRGRGYGYRYGYGYGYGPYSYAKDEQPEGVAG